MGDIININCKNCKDNEDYFVGMGMSGQLTKLYHCHKCNFLDVQLDERIENFRKATKDYKIGSDLKWVFSEKNIYCSECKSSDIISIMDEIKELDIPKYNCHKCGQKQLVVFSAGDWD